MFVLAGIKGIESNVEFVALLRKSTEFALTQSIRVREMRLLFGEWRLDCTQQRWSEVDCDGRSITWLQEFA